MKPYTTESPLPIPGTKNKKKRDRRKKLKPVHAQSPQNKWTKMRETLDNLRKIVENYVSKSKNWDTWPPGWTHKKYKQIREYCLKELEDHHDGRRAAILGGQKQREVFDSWLWNSISTLQNARKRGIIGSDEFDDDDNQTLERLPMLVQEILDAAVETVEDNGETLTFLKLGGKTFAIGPIFTGETRADNAKAYKQRLQECLYALHQQLQTADQP